MLHMHRRLARDYDHRPDNAASRVYWASTAGMLRRLTPCPHLPGRPGACRVNVSKLLRLLQTEHDETALRADSLRDQIERLTTALAETEARLAELTTTCKVIDGHSPPNHATAPPGPPAGRLKIR